MSILLSLINFRYCFQSFTLQKNEKFEFQQGFSSSSNGVRTIGVREWGGQFCQNFVISERLHITGGDLVLANEKVNEQTNNTLLSVGFEFGQH